MSANRVTGHWHRFEDNFQTAPLDFYTNVEAALAKRNLPGIEVNRIEHKEAGLGSAARTYLRIRRGGYLFDVCCAHYARGTFFSWWAQKPGGSPLFLLVFVVLLLAFLGSWFLTFASFIFGQSYGIYLFFGLVTLPAAYFLGYVISEGGGELEERILMTPYLGRLYDFVYNPNSFYRQDLAIMFRENASAAVLEAVDAVLIANQRPPLKLGERTPTVKDLPG